MTTISTSNDLYVAAYNEQNASKMYRKPSFTTEDDAATIAYVGLYHAEIAESRECKRTAIVNPSFVTVETTFTLRPEKKSTFSPTSLMVEAFGLLVIVGGAVAANALHLIHLF